MKRYRYRARSASQRLEEGILEAESAESAARALAGRGLYPLSLDPEPDRQRGGGGASRGRLPDLLRRDRWSLSDQADFARQLADLIAGGLTVLRALEVLEKQARTPTVGSTLAELQRAVRDGVPLSAALASRGRHFPKTLVSAVRAGEASGALEEVLQNVADLLEREDLVLRKVREALTYPGVVSAVGALTLGVLFMYVIPRITILYEDLGQILPLPTRILLGISHLSFRIGIPALLLLGLGAWWLFRNVQRSEAWRVRLGRFLLRLPVVGRILLLRELVRFARVLATLTSGGVPVLEALGLAAEASGNAHFAAEIREVRRKIYEGGRLGEAMADSRVLAGPLVAMVQVGEEGGELARALRKAARIGERDLEGALKRLTTLLEPLLILVLGSVVGFVAFAMMLPLLQVDFGAG